MQITLLNTHVGEGFNVAAGPGMIFSGGAVSFTPNQDCRLTGITLSLKGYTGLKGQNFGVQLCDDGPQNQPTNARSFVIPPPNDGSLGEFTFTLSENADLKAGQTYWILVYGGHNSIHNEISTVLTWVGGGKPNGNATFNKSLLYSNSGYSPSSVIPSFSINAEIA